jgi:phosphoglycerate dehydrogenase-like enzyme
MADKVLVDPGFRSVEEVFTPSDLDRLNKMADVIWLKGSSNPDASVDLARREAVAVVAADWRYGPVEQFSKLRAILEVSGRFPDPEQLDYAACAQRGISILSCAPAFGPAVAEMALAVTLACGRDLVEGDRLMRTGEERWGRSGNGRAFLLYDQPVGFIGFGSLARSLKLLLTPFRCPIQVVDPGMTEAYLRSQGVVPTHLDHLLATSKVIYVLAAPTPDNRAMLDRSRLELIGKDALLVLISRAHLVDFDAMTEMVLAGRFRAAIDVFPEEPLPRDHPIRTAPCAILSAHRAGGDALGFQNIGRIVVNDLDAIMAHLPPREMQLSGTSFLPTSQSR